MSLRPTTMLNSSTTYTNTIHITRSCVTGLLDSMYFIHVNMALRRIFGPRRDEVTGEWRRMHNEELNDLYCSPNIVRVIKWKRMRWAGHVARMREERGCIGSWWGNRGEGDHWGDLGVDGWIILGRNEMGWACGAYGCGEGDV